MIAVRYVDIQGICAGSVIHLDPSNAAYEDACSKGNATQLSIRDVLSYPEKRWIKNNV